MHWLYGIILLITFEIIADIFSKEYSLKGNWFLWLGAITGYVIANVFWLYAIRKGSGLARGATLFSVGSAIAAIIIGLGIYREKIPSYQLLGIGLGILAIILLTQE